jgi:hypothetical protein
MLMLQVILLLLQCPLAGSVMGWAVLLAAIIYACFDVYRPEIGPFWQIRLTSTLLIELYFSYQIIAKYWLNTIQG